MANTMLVFEKGNQKKYSCNWNWEDDGSNKKSKQTEKLNTNKDQNKAKFRITTVLLLSKKRRLKAPIAGSSIREDNNKDKVRFLKFQLFLVKLCVEF
jgi:hypothetical protein